jgi:hypothetical protein
LLERPETFGEALRSRWRNVALEMTVLFAKPPAVAGEPIADLMLSYQDRSAINGALFKLDKRVRKPDKAMNDEVFGKKLWDELELLTRLTPE